MSVSGNEPGVLSNLRMIEEMETLRKMSVEPLHPDLLGWVEDGQWGPMLRHPLVYSIPLTLPGLANKTYAHKRKRLAEALELKDWGSVVFLHERAHRLTALIDHVIGRYSPGGTPMSLSDLVGPGTNTEDVLNLVADVWVDSENIGQMVEDWRVLFGTCEGFFLGTYVEELAFRALPDPIHAYRAGIDDGDWSWTTNRGTAEFFARRFRTDDPLPVVEADIPKDQCFGYLTRRGEAELLVRLDPDRVSGNADE